MDKWHIAFDARSRKLCNEFATCVRLPDLEEDKYLVQFKFKVLQRFLLLLMLLFADLIWMLNFAVSVELTCPSCQGGMSLPTETRWSVGCNLLLNTAKTKELVVDFRKKKKKTSSRCWQRGSAFWELTSGRTWLASSTTLG